MILELAEDLESFQQRCKVVMPLKCSGDVFQSQILSGLHSQVQNGEREVSVRGDWLRLQSNRSS